MDLPGWLRTGRALQLHQIDQRGTGAGLEDVDEREEEFDWEKQVARKSWQNIVPYF